MNFLAFSSSNAVKVTGATTKEKKSIIGCTPNQAQKALENVRQKSDDDFERSCVFDCGSRQSPFFPIGEKPLEKGFCCKRRGDGCRGRRDGRRNARGDDNEETRVLNRNSKRREERRVANSSRYPTGPDISGRICQERERVRRDAGADDIDGLRTVVF